MIEVQLHLHFACHDIRSVFFDRQKHGRGKISSCHLDFRPKITLIPENYLDSQKITLIPWKIPWLPNNYFDSPLITFNSPKITLILKKISWFPKKYLDSPRLGGDIEHLPHTKCNCLTVTGSDFINREICCNEMKKVILDNLPENFMQIFCSQNIGEDRLEEYIGVISSYMSFF